MRSLTFNMCESGKQINVDYHTSLLKTTLPGHTVKVFRKQISPLMTEQCDLHSSPNFIRVIKSRMRWVGHEARMGKETSIQVFWWLNLRERGQLEDPNVDGRIILKCNCKSDGGTTWIFSRDSSVGVATRLGLDDPRFERREGQKIFLLKTSILALGPTQPRSSPRG